MSYYIQNDGILGPQIASNSGWGDFGEWAESLDAESHGEIAHLFSAGWSDQPTTLAEQLADAIENSPSDDAEVMDIAGWLVDLIDAETVVSVTDGIGEADEEDDAGRSVLRPLAFDIARRLIRRECKAVQAMQTRKLDQPAKTAWLNNHEADTAAHATEVIAPLAMSVALLGRVVDTKSIASRFAAQTTADVLAGGEGMYERWHTERAKSLVTEILG